MKSLGSMGEMRTTLDSHDELLKRAKLHAKSAAQPLRARVGECVRLVGPSQSVERIIGRIQ